MYKLISDGLWREIRRLAGKSNVRMAAVAYVTSDHAIKFKEGDLLIADASDHAIKSAQTSVPILRQAFERGVLLYSCPGLHAKVMILDGVAVIGSANISQSSENSLIEAALLTDSPSVVAMARSFLQQLQEDSTLIDGKFIKRAGSLEVKRGFGRKFQPARKPQTKIKISTPRTWIVSLAPAKEKQEEAELPYIEKGEKKAEENLHKPSSYVGWIRMTDLKSRVVREAQPGDSVIRIFNEVWTKKKADFVFFHAPILFRQKEPNCVRLFFEYSSNAEKLALTWRQFQRLAKQIGLPFRLSPQSTRLLPEEYSEAMAAIWKEAKKRE